LIHGRARYPEGHGKIERFNSTVFQQALRSYAGNPTVDPSLAALELRLSHFIFTGYNRNFHEGIQTTPEKRFTADTRALDYPFSTEELQQKFVLSEDKKVRKTNIISHNSVKYDVPLGHAGCWIKMYRNVLTDKLYVIHEGRAVEIHPTDPHKNARERRPRRPVKTSKGIPSTAADRRFHKDFSPIIDPDGGFQQTEE